MTLNIMLHVVAPSMVTCKFVLKHQARVKCYKKNWGGGAICIFL